MEGRDNKSIARKIFLRALAEVDIGKAFDRQLDYQRGVLRVCEDLYDLRSFSRVFVVSIGKAGRRMAEALSQKLGSTVQGIVADPDTEMSLLPGYRHFSGSHPQPNIESIRGAEAILKSLSSLDDRAMVLFMISGGGSSVVEKPMDRLSIDRRGIDRMGDAEAEAISLDDLIATYRVLVLSGAPIAQINAVRKHLSLIKGGRMAAAAAQTAQQVSILVSDVPENALDFLSSGPTMPDSSSVEDCYRIVNEYGILEDLPASVREIFSQRALEETPKPGDPAFARSRWWKVLSSETAEKTAAEAAAREGFAVEIDHSCDDWDYVKAADYLLDRLRHLRSGVSKVCLVSGGEVTVKVAGKSGVGGRNQQFALYCAEKIAGENTVVLSAGTDGIDGNSPVAGGLADGTTLDRARNAGLDAANHLREFNAFPLLETLGDIIHTGPTGTNVRDLRILLAY